LPPLGAFLNVTSSSIYGANIANNRFLKALLKHSSLGEVHLFYDSLSLTKAEKEIKELIKVDRGAVDGVERGSQTEKGRD